MLAGISERSQRPFKRTAGFADEMAVDTGSAPQTRGDERLNAGGVDGGALFEGGDMVQHRFDDVLIAEF